MCVRLLFATLALLALNLRAANIVWVSDTPNTNGSGATVGWSAPITGTLDDSFVTLLQNAGHNVVRFTSDDNTANVLSAGDIAALNTNDLIIIGRAMSSGFSSGAQGVQWNTAITKPMIVQSVYLTRVGNFGWFVTNNVPNGVPMQLTATAGNAKASYLFNLYGSTVNGLTTVSNYDEALAQNTSQTFDNPVAGGVVLATGLGTNKVIVEFPAGTAVRGGALAGYRMLFASGNREYSTAPSNSIAYAGAENLTPTGEGIFLRAVQLAINNGVVPNSGQAPVITLNPANTAVCTGLPLTLTSEATGENPLSFRWYFNDTAIPNGTNATYRINSFDATNAGNYYVVVSNAVGGLTAVTSTVASVTVSGTGTAVTIAGATNCPGTPVTFTANAVGSGTLQYTFYKGATLLQGPGVNNTYSIASVAPSDAGNYSVVTVGDCNTVTNSFSLTVITAPTITVQPTSQGTPIGNGVAFNVTATAAGVVPSYQWQTNGVTVPGAASSTFTISNATLAMNGIEVRAIASTCVGSVTSSIVKLVVVPNSAISFDFNSPGQFTNILYNRTTNDWISRNTLPNPLNEHPTAGVAGSGGLSLLAGTADTTHILQNPTFDFSQNGKTLVASAMVKIKSITTTNARVIQLGFLTETNAYDSATGGTALGVNDNNPQAFMTVILQSTATNVGQIYQLRLQHRLSTGGIAEVTPTPSAGFVSLTNLVPGNWYKIVGVFSNLAGTTANSVAISATVQDMGPSGNTPGSLIMSYDPTTIVNSTMVSSRLLYLSVRNSAPNGGADVLDNIYAHSVFGDASFTTPVADQTVEQGKHAIFRAYVEGTPPFTYQWKSNGVDIPGANNWKFVTQPTRTSDDGTYYEVTVTGATGNPVTSSAAFLSVTAKPLNVVSVGSADGSIVGVRFNQRIDKATAESVANYTINGVNPVKAVLRADGETVLLTSPSLLVGGFTVVAQNVLDLSGNAVASGTATGLAVTNLTSIDISPVTQSPLTTPPGTTYSFASNSFEITAGGADIWNAADSFRFVYTTRTGDFDLVAKVPYEDIVRTPTKAGFNARVTLDPTSPMAGMAVNPPWPGRNYYEGMRRDTYNVAAVSYGTTTRATFPDVWLRFRRVGQSFYRFSSTNGVNWLLDGQASVIMPPTIYVGLAACSVANGTPATMVFENVSEYSAPASTITITTQPLANVTVAAGGSTNLVVAATASGSPSNELSYVWQRFDGASWTNLINSGTNNGTYTVGPLYASDSGAQFRAVVRLPGASDVTSSVTTVTVTDSAAPTIASASTVPQSLNQLIISFSEPMGNSATNLANYTLTNNAGATFTLSGATFLHGDRRTVALTTANPLPPGFYFVRVAGVSDLNNVALATVVRGFTHGGPLGPVLIEVYQDNGGTTAATDTQNHPMYRTNMPAFIVYSNLAGFNVSFTGIQDLYGVHGMTLFQPPTNGQYKFWMRTDDGGQLWMNTNGPFAILTSGRNSPGAQRAPYVADGNANTKWLCFDRTNCTLTMTPLTPTAVAGLRVTTANDAPERDPITLRIEGTTGSQFDGPWTFIADVNTGIGTDPGRLTAGPNVAFANATVYTHYRITITGLRNYAAANSVQIGELTLLNGSSATVQVHNTSLLVENTGSSGSYSLGNTIQASVTNLTLSVTQQYFMEFFMKENTGGDGVAVNFTHPSIGTAPTASFGGTNLMYPFTVAQPTPVLVEIYSQYPTPYGNVNLGGSDLSTLAFSTNTEFYVEGLPNNLQWGAYEYHFAAQATLINTRFDNYVGRIMSYFVAPSNGNYKFYMASDDSSQLFMNTNAVNSTDPAGKRLIGQLTAFTGNYTLVAQNVTLSAGQRYYLEAIWKEGTGGDGVRVAVRAQGDTSTPPGTEIIPASMLELPYSLSRVGPVNVAGLQPEAPTVSDGQTVTFRALGITGQPNYSFIWLKNGVPVYYGSPYAGLAMYTTDPLTAADNGAVYTLVITNPFSRIERSTTVTVNSGNPPQVVSVVGSQYRNTVTITYNEIVDQVSALSLGSYNIPGLTLYGASIDNSGKSVVLTTSPQLFNTVYTVNINGVKDLSGNTLVTSTNFTSWGVGGSAVLVELFTNLPGTLVTNLTQSGKFIANAPDVVGFVTRFGYDSRIGQTATASLNGFGPFPGDGLAFYGARLSAYFIAPSNGNYRFYISSDDMSELWMNTNSVNSMDPAGKVLIAQLNVACCKNYGDASGGNNNSALQVGNITLQGGQLYYIEGLLKEGGGGDYFRMAFREATDPSVPADTEVASAVYFTTAGNPDVNKLIVSQVPTNAVVDELTTATFSLVASLVPTNLTPFVTYTWQRFDGSTYTNIPGANAPSYSLLARMSDDGAQFRLLVSLPGTSNSYDATLTVIPDTTPPYLVGAGSLDGNTLVVRFNEAVDMATATDPLSYTVDGNFPTTTGENGGLGTLLADQKTVVFKLDPNAEFPLPEGTFVVDAFFIGNQAATIAYGNSSTNGSIVGLTAAEIGVPSIAAGGYNSAATGLPGTYLNNSVATPTLYPDSAIGVGVNAVDVSANGWDIWNVADGFQFNYRQIAGDFDIKVRVDKFLGADQWSKAGLMFRSDLTNVARNVFFGVTPAASPILTQTPVNNHTFQWRDVDNTASGNLTTTTNPPTYPNSWLRLQRVGNVFNGYLSSNGTDWTLYASRTNVTMSTVGYLGLATVSHDQTRSLANNAQVSYRDLYFPFAPVITTQPGPADQMVAIHTDVVLGGAVATGTGPYTYQWLKDGALLSGQNAASLTLTNVKVTDSGTYSLIIGNDGGGTVSSNMLLVVSNALPVAVTDNLVVNENTPGNVNGSTLVANDNDPEGDALTIIGVSGVLPTSYTANFNDGLTPAGMTLYPVATILPTGGQADTAYLQLNSGIGSVSGSAVISELTPGKRVSAFTASFKVRISDVSGQPADGMSFNFGPDLPDAATLSGYAAENGITAQGFSFCIDNYQFFPLAVGAGMNTPGGATANTSGIKITYGGIIIAGVQTPTWNSTRWIPISITVSASGVANVVIDGTNALANVTLPGYVAKTGRFGFFARTGGQYESHGVDDIALNVVTEDTGRESFADARLYGNAYLSSTGGVANSGVLHLTDAVNGQLGALVINDILGGNALTSFDASFQLKIQAGSSPGADGFSFNFAGDLPNAAVVGAEAGVGTGLSVGIKNYPTGSEAMIIKNGGNTLATVSIAVWNSPNFIPVAISLTADGKLTVRIDGTNVVSGLATGYTPSAGRFGLYARTGGLNQTHWIDDLSINAYSASGSGYVSKNFENVGGPGSVTLSGGVVTYNPNGNSCGNDTFYYIATDGQDGGLTTGTVNVTINPTNNVAPVISSCPGNRNIALDGNCEFVMPELRGSLLASGSCISVNQTPAPGTVLGAGSHVVTFTVTDAQSLQATCNATVTGIDLTPDQLLITKVGNNVVITWTSCVSHSLYESNDIGSPTNWAPSSATISSSGTSHSVTIPADQAARFYQLR